MQKIVNLNKNPFLRDRLFLALGVFTLLCAWLVYKMSISAGGWLALHEEFFPVIFIELLPLFLIGFLLFITSSSIPEGTRQSFENSRHALIHNVAAALHKIKTNEFNSERDVTGDPTIDQALSEIFAKFTTDAQEEDNRNWSNEGLATFRQIMSSHVQIKGLCEEVIGKLVKYIGAAQGGIFISNQDHQLELTSCYAYERKKYLQKTILPGEGLAGQCYLEGHRIYMTKVPDQYVNITSGLGAANPHCLIILPLKLKETIVGVLELASFKPFKPFQLDFLDKVSEALAQSIDTIRTTEQTKELLNQSLRKEQEMRDQEERMKQSLEELYVTQEDMRKMNLEMEEILKAINTLTATVELNHQGQVLKLNDRFLHGLQLEAQDVYGKELALFLNDGKEGRGLFSTLWPTVLNGKSVERVFQFNDSNGSIRWFRTGMYPLQGKDGTDRVLCFLNDVSEIMIKEAELNKLNAEVEAFRKMLIRILNEIPLKVFLKQYNGKFFVVNDAVSRFHGFETPDGLIGKSDFDFYDHKDASEWLEAEHKIIREGKTEYTHADGGRILRTVKLPFYIDPLNETGLLGYQADVTELEMLKKAAADSKQ